MRLRFAETITFHIAPLATHGGLPLRRTRRQPPGSCPTDAVRPHPPRLRAPVTPLPHDAPVPSRCLSPFSRPHRKRQRGSRTVATHAVEASLAEGRGHTLHAAPRRINRTQGREPVRRSADVGISIPRVHGRRDGIRNRGRRL